MAPSTPSPPPAFEVALHLLLPRNPSTGSVGAGDGDWRAHASDEDLVIEGWSEGYMVGSLIIMACITIANMRSKVLLHKLILLEQVIAMSHGTFCFMSFHGYGWYLSSTATLLYLSWIVHNIVAWMKVRPFFSDPRGLFKLKTGKWVRNIYLSTLALTVPVIIFEIYNNFRFFNNINNLYERVRPYEPLMRDPWWVFTCLVLFRVVSKVYGTGVTELVRRSPRFGILLGAILLSMTFTTLDIVASIHNFIGTTDGINPWWKLSLVFKCLTDTIMLDDFKTELKRLGIKRIQQEEKRRQSTALILDDKYDDDSYDRELEFADALNTNPARLHQKSSLRRTNTAGTGDTPPGRMRQDSMEMNGNAEKRGGARDGEGRGGVKISNLPGLKSLGKKKKHDEEDAVASEKDQPTGVTAPTLQQKQKQKQRDPIGDSDSLNEDDEDRHRGSGALDFQTMPEGY